MSASTPQACLEQALDNVDSLPHAGRDEVSEYGDVVVCNMPVGHRALLAVAEVVAREKVIVVEVVLRAVSRHGLTVPPMLGQVELEIQLDQFALRGFKPFETHMPPIDERHHVRCHPFAHVASCLRPRLQPIAKIVSK